ncbi:methylated-DNA--[protein]-cysteine S-methyltransferase [Streptacidiphilus sp. 4-A2]|nr:methylated-DNA--[protein]-cysteine S-methyltransferase [Streptacidiphilus sp. 4-A2]
MPRTTDEDSTHRRGHAAHHRGLPDRPVAAGRRRGGRARRADRPGHQGPDRCARPEWEHDPAPFAAATEQLAAYFDGELTAFDLPLAPRGSEFRRRVWTALDSIPYGETVTYGELAAEAGQPPASVRAVAGAIGANPLLIIRPCHRVIGANGSLTGFAAGLDAKRLLLRLEAADRTSSAESGRASRPRRAPLLRRVRRGLLRRAPLLQSLLASVARAEANCSSPPRALMIAALSCGVIAASAVAIRRSCARCQSASCR